MKKEHMASHRRKVPRGRVLSLSFKLMFPLLKKSRNPIQAAKASGSGHTKLRKTQTSSVNLYMYFVFCISCHSSFKNSGAQFINVSKYKHHKKLKFAYFIQIKKLRRSNESVAKPKIWYHSNRSFCCWEKITKTSNKTSPPTPESACT